MIFFKKISPKNSAKNWRFLTQIKAKLCKMLIITLVFEKKRLFFRRKLSKIAENCDHNIDPRLGEFSTSGRLFTLGSFLKKYKCNNPKTFGILFSSVKVMH
jgi:hypothetical protein